MRHAKVSVPARVLDGLEAVRLSGKTNMFDIPIVVNLAVDMGFPHTAIWVSENRSLYCQGLLRGFEPMESRGDGQPGRIADREGGD